MEAAVEQLQGDDTTATSVADDGEYRAPEYEPLTDRERTLLVAFGVACAVTLLVLFFVVMVLGHSPAFS
jgi:hypothetical protein